MGDIYNSANQKMATIGQDGIVYNILRAKLGRVLDNGDVRNIKEVKIGSYDSSGYVYEGARRIGKIKSDGRIYDYENDYVGKVIGANMQSAGAALLLLVR